MIRVTVDDRGLITSLYDVAARSRGHRPGHRGNLLQLHPDSPNMWDAWDVDTFYKNNVSDLTEADRRLSTSRASRPSWSAVLQPVQRHPDAAAAAGRQAGRRGGPIDWHEPEKFLKARSRSTSTPTGPPRRRSSGTSSGRPTPTRRGTPPSSRRPPTGSSTSPRTATARRRERLDLRPRHLATARDDGGTTTTVRLSLLRAPQFPDPQTDQGPHTVNHALVVGAEINDAVQQGYRINLPVRAVAGAEDVEPLVTVDNASVVVGR